MEYALTVTAETKAELLEFLGGCPGPASPNPKIEAPKAPKTKVPKNDKPKTEAEVRAILLDAVERCGKDAVRDCLQSFGVKKLPELPAEQYPDLLTKIEAIPEATV